MRIGAVLKEQILLRAIATEFMLQTAARAPDPGEAVRALCNRMHSLVDRYDLPGSDNAEMEAAREAARMNIDAMGVVAMNRL